MTEVQTLIARLERLDSSTVAKRFSYQRWEYWTVERAGQDLDGERLWAEFGQIHGAEPPADFKYFIDTVGACTLGGMWEIFSSGYLVDFDNHIRVEGLRDEVDVFFESLVESGFRSFANDSGRLHVGWTRTDTTPFAEVVAIDIELLKFDRVGRTFATAMLAWLDGGWPRGYYP